MWTFSNKPLKPSKKKRLAKSKLSNLGDRQDRARVANFELNDKRQSDDYDTEKWLELLSD